MVRIYLDNAATTPMLPQVVEAMRPWLTTEFGNPSSLHAEGRKAREAIDRSRATLADKLGVLFAEVTFTSSGTEAANLGILGAALGNNDTGRNRILLGAAEHHCVLHTTPLLERLGYSVETIPVDRVARVRIDRLQELMAEDVLLVSVMHANNELGTIQPVQDVTQLAKQVGALVHCDAVASFGSLDVRPDELGVDLLSLSAHKINGPKGVGALYVRAGTKVSPLSLGGGQERELRAGTENVACIVGFARAVDLLDGSSSKAPRDAFVRRSQELRPPGLEFTTDFGEAVLPGHAHLRFAGISAEPMLIVLDREGISASSGAACSSGSLEPSHVLLAAGYSEAQAKEGLRFTFGRTNTVEEALHAAEVVSSAAQRLSKTG